MTYRITIESKDASSTAIGSTSSVGAMVVRSPKGQMTPFKVTQGNEAKIINLCGTPSATYPDIWEAIQYNRTNDIWLTCPYDTSADKLGGVLVTESGSVALATGVADGGVSGYTFTATANQTVTETLTSSDYTTYTITTTFAVVTPNTTTSAYLNGTNLSLVFGSILGTVYPITGTGLTTGSQFDTSTNILTLKFTAAKTASDIVTVEYTASVKPYFLLTTNSPYATDDLGVKVTRNSSTKIFTINLYKKLSTGVWKSLKTYTVGYVSGNKDGYGKNIFIEDVINVNTDDYLLSKTDSTTVSTIFLDDTGIVAFAGGSRTTTVTTAMISSSWNYFKSATQYPADIFMDPTADSGVPDKFTELETTYQPFAFYIMSMAAGLTSTQAISAKNAYGVDNAGLAFYWNRARVNDTYNNSSFWTSLIGRVGQKLAAMSDIYDGGAPMWIDENKHGGILGSGILEMEQYPAESELQSLDTNGVNAITLYGSNKYMIMSQKTAQDPNNLSDYSYIAHSRLFKYIKKNIVNNVLIYQIGKLNDDYHQRLAKSKGTVILQPIVTSGLLTEAGIQCDSGNNDSIALSQKQFIYTLAVKVTPYSEQIVFEFVNVGQTVSISDYIGSQQAA